MSPSSALPSCDNPILSGFTVLVLPIASFLLICSFSAEPRWCRYSCCLTQRNAPQPSSCESVANIILLI